MLGNALRWKGTIYIFSYVNTFVQTIVLKAIHKHMAYASMLIYTLYDINTQVYRYTIIYFPIDNLFFYWWAPMLLPVWRYLKRSWSQYVTQIFWCTCDFTTLRWDPDLDLVVDVMTCVVFFNIPTNLWKFPLSHTLGNFFILSVL